MHNFYSMYINNRWDYNNRYLFETILIVSGLIYLCTKIISEEEFRILSLDKFLSKHKL